MGRLLFDMRCDECFYHCVLFFCKNHYSRRITPQRSGTSNVGTHYSAASIHESAHVVLFKDILSQLGFQLQAVEMCALESNSSNAVLTASLYINEDNI